MREQPILTIALQTAATTGNGVVLFPSDYEEVTIYLRGNGSITAGVVTIEEDFDGTATTWSGIGAAAGAITLTVGTNVTQAFHVPVGLYSQIRARISTTVTGGTVTVTAMAAQFRSC